MADSESTTSGSSTDPQRHGPHARQGRSDWAGPLVGDVLREAQYAFMFNASADMAVSSSPPYIQGHPTKALHSIGHRSGARQIPLRQGPPRPSRLQEAGPLPAHSPGQRAPSGSGVLPPARPYCSRGQLNHLPPRGLNGHDDGAARRQEDRGRPARTQPRRGKSYSFESYYFPVF